VERDGIEGGVLRPSPLEVHVVSYRHVPDVLGDFLFVSLVDKDERIMFGVSPVVEHPLIAGMVSVILITADRDVGRGRGRRCHSLEERRRLILHRDCMSQIGLDEIGECGNVCEVSDGVIFAHSDWEREIGLMLGHGVDGDHYVNGGPGHDGGVVHIHRLVATDGTAKGDGPIYLVLLRHGRFVLDMLNVLRLWWGRGEACEISFNL
jgi:hypothetical protein